MDASSPDDRWPFGATGGTPEGRPLMVEMEGVLIAILDDDAAGEHARAALLDLGFREQELRLYRSDEILAYDEQFRADRNLTGRIVGAVVDDSETMDEYVEYARQGRSALWVLAPLREDANRVVRRLADERTTFIWYHGQHGLETLPM